MKYVGSVLVDICEQHIDDEDADITIVKMVRECRNNDGSCFEHLILDAVKRFDEKGDDARPVAMDLRSRCDIVTESRLAHIALSIQDACNERAVSRTLFTGLRSLRFEGIQCEHHPAIYLIMDKLASMGLYTQDFDNYSKAHDHCVTMAQEWRDHQEYMKSHT